MSDETPASNTPVKGQDTSASLATGPVRKFDNMSLIAIGLAISTTALLVSTIFLAVDRKTETEIEEVVEFSSAKPRAGDNICAGKKIDFPNTQCIIDQVYKTGEQSGTNVTKGYVGKRDTNSTPLVDPYWMHDLCPVNVHWHLGTEHYSVGEYDENGKGPDLKDVRETQTDASDGGKVREGFQCRYYEVNDAKFNTPYDWKHCVDMQVGETYEVHWPHSAAGDCGTPNQYQTPFYDGVFCHAEKLDLSILPQQVGVQAQVFTVVNDEAYYYPDLIRGMIVDGDMGKDIAKYTGSTTGTSRDNTICSMYAPITWQVDRKCHIISASSFDKLCADMKAQRDDMSEDLYPHGSRELVADEHAANNHQGRFLRRH